MSRLIAAWVSAAQRRALVVVIVALLGGIGLASYIGGHLAVDTDSENLLSPELPWRKAAKQLDQAFPKLNHTLVVVLEGAAPEAIEDAQGKLVAKLRAHAELYDEVFAIETEPYFRRNGLLFLEPDALQKLADELTQAQPFLGTLDQDPSLRALFTLLGRAAEAPGAQDFDLSPAFGHIAEATQAAAEGRDAPMSWQGLIGDPSTELGGSRRFIELAAKLDFDQILPAQAPIAGVRAAIAELKLAEVPGLRVRLTGSVAMEHEEILTAFSGASWALGLAMLMAAGLLYLALRSLKLVIAAVITLIYGLLATTAFAAVAVGHLNLISVAFGVLYVGLGLDYALYLCMQYRERLGQGLAGEGALAQSAADVGGYMTVCAATCSLGFLAFVPTSFTGIAELGIISGAGMFISLGLSLTLLPALIALFRPDTRSLAWQPTTGGALGRVLALPYSKARAIWIVTGLLVVVSLGLVPRARFDADPLNLRDQKSEALATFRDLMRDPNIPTLTLSALAADEASARALADAASKLSTVARALTLADFVPTQQDEKLAILADLATTLGPQLALAPAPTAPVARDDDARALEALRSALPAMVAKSAGKSADAAQSLAKALDAFSAALAKADEAGKAQLLAGLRANLLGTLPSRLAGLKQALSAGAVTEADLPAALVERWRAKDGRYRVEFQPKAVLDDPAVSQRFIDDVVRVAPGAVGAPLSQNESGAAVVHAFQQAFASAFVVITLLLLVLLRSFIDTLLVLVPLIVAGLLTVAGSVLFAQPFNFANVIALPLILGVGVDYGVYLVQRGRDAADGSLLRTGTARAVLYGALITMVNFGNLIFAKHPGMVSMGFLLTLGLGMTLLAALVLLPSLLALRWRHLKAP
jgi:hopanoid biosynthesis associated RND transporter like protein HpnN